MPRRLQALMGSPTPRPLLAGRDRPRRRRPGSGCHRRALAGSAASSAMPTRCASAGSWCVPPGRGRGRTPRLDRSADSGRLALHAFFEGGDLAPLGRCAARAIEHAARRPHRVRGLPRDVQPVAARRLAQARRPPAEPMRLVFIATPGPGGGGGGGGLLQKAPPPKALREGRRAISSPVPVRREPKPIEPVPAPPEPKPEPLKAEPLPAVVGADHHGAGRYAEPRRRARPDAGRNRQPWTGQRRRRGNRHGHRPRRRRRQRDWTRLGRRHRRRTRIAPAAGSSRPACCAK